MATVRIRSFFFSFLALIFFHLGCFTVCKTTDRSSLLSKKRKKSSSSSAASSWLSLKRIFFFNKKTDLDAQIKNQILPITSPTSRRSSNATPADTLASTPSRKRRTLSFSDSSLDHNSFPLRNDIFPCPTCGEIFHKTHLLENHQSVRHAVSELYDGDSGKNIVNIIFKTSWNENVMKNPTVHRILKIHNSPKILAKFEEYRESVKSKAVSSARRRDERCIADGNELLRFQCCTFICNLGQNGNSSLCSQHCCSVCGIIRLGFSAKMDGISTMSSSWKAHSAMPDDLEEEFAFMNVKRAVLICRVVAGRIGSDQEVVVEKDESGYDSVVGRGNGIIGGTFSRSEDDELLVFNPRAVLPCFVIVYSVQV